MTVVAGISISEGNLIVHGTKILNNVHQNIILTPCMDKNTMTGAFIGVNSDHGGGRCVFPVGMLLGLEFMCTFRFKLWWMTQRMGSCGKDIPFETQFLMIKENDESNLADNLIYTVLLPILEGDFRAVLQGNENDDIEICLESGDPDVDKFEGTHVVFVAAGLNPFDVISNAVKIVKRHLQTFSHREKKKMPDVLNWFGWCTWDAFYTNVTVDGVKSVLECLENGGIPPKFVIIDDGWQSVSMDSSGVANEADNAANFANRLTTIKENHKFQKNGQEGQHEEDPSMGISHIVKESSKNIASRHSTYRDEICWTN